MIHTEEVCVSTKTLETRITCDVCQSEIWARSEDDPQLPDIDLYQLYNHRTAADRLDVCDSCAGRLIGMARSGLLATTLKELGE